MSLTGQASEDEPRESDERPQQRQCHRECSQQSRQITNRQNELASDNNDALNDATTAAVARSHRWLLSYLPCPVDLWNSGTLVSLLLLPLAFLVCALFQLPLDYNSSAPARTMTLGEWSGRAKDVDKMSNELNTIEKDLHTAEEDHIEIRGMYLDLKERLEKMKERKERREERLRVWREREEEREREKEQREQRPQEPQKQQGGMAREGPISTVTMVKALAVTTFAGKQPVVDDVKKGS